MKKFTFKGVLDGFRSSVQAAPRGADQEIQETLRPEHFQLKKTFRHGFPFSPTAMAWDPVQKLLAIGDKSGSLRILGRAGVDAHVRHEGAVGAGACGELAVLHVHFLVNEGALVTATADDVLHLWNFKEKTPQVVQSIKFQRERITCLQLPLQSKWLHVGTERGNVHVVHIDTFVLSGYVINWNKAIEVTRGNHPGAVVQIIDSPLDPSKLLIAFESGLVVVWDLRQRCAEFRGHAGAAVRGAAWHPEGKQFLSAHTDGALATWTLRTPPKPTQLTYPHAKANKEGKLESCKPIHKVEWKTSRTGETYVVFSGGLPTDKTGRSPSITVVAGKTTTVLEMEYNVVDFITLCESPWTSDYQDPYAIVVLLQHDLVVIDLLSPGYPCFENPYPMDLHEAPVTCCCYLADCPSDLIPAFYSVGRQCSQQKVGFSENEWPINGGEWAPASCSYSEIILTGHADGSVKFWDASAGTLQVLYKLKSSRVFERRAGSVVGAGACGPDEESPLSVQLVALCAESRRLAVAVAAAHVVLFKFRKTEIVSETHVLDVPLITESLEESDTSPDNELPRTMPVRSTGGGGGQDSIETERRGTSAGAGSGEVRVRGAQGTGGIRKAPGFQATLVCLQPCAAGAPTITALTLNSSYGLMAYGGERGIIIVDVSRKCIVAALAPASLYGNADPWGRAPATHAAARRDTVTSEQRSPSIDQLEEALAELAGVPRTSPPPASRSSDMANDSQDATPVNSTTTVCFPVNTLASATTDVAVEVADEAYLVLTPTEAVAIPQASGSPEHASLPGPVALVGSDERNKIEAAQCRRKSSTWKGFNLKRQLSKVDIKFKNTFSLPPEKKELEASQAKPGSVFYCSSSEITPLSPTERSSDPANREVQSKPESTQISPDSDSTLGSSDDKQELKDIVPELIDNVIIQKSGDMYDRMHRELRDAYGWREDRDDSGKLPNSSSQSPPKTEVSERRVTINVLEGVQLSRPDNLPLFDEDGQPVRPPRHSKKSKSTQGEREKREQRLLSVPNIKYKQESILKDLRKRDAQQPSAPSFAGNIIRRFRTCCVCKAGHHNSRHVENTNNEEVIVPNKHIEPPVSQAQTSMDSLNVIQPNDKLDNSFSRSRSSSMSSLENISSEAIQCLAFADSYTKKSDPTMLQATLWIGTSLGSVLTVMINLPEADSRHTQPVVISNTGGPIFRLKGSILAMSFLDCNGALIPYSYECWRDENKEQAKDRRERTPTKQSSSSSGSRMSPTPGDAFAGGSSGTGAGAPCGDRQFVVIASEKQARVVALPSQNCVYRQQIADTDFVVKAEIVSLKDSVCLVNYISTGHLVAYSLPSLRPLIDVDFLPLADLSFQTQSKQGGIVDPMLSIWGQQLIVNEDTDQIAKTFCFSNKGHGLYLSSPTELQKFTIDTEFCQSLNDMMGELFLPRDMPEPPKESFFKGLFGVGSRPLDREELFGEQSGKASRAVAKHVTGTGEVAALGARASTASSEISRAHQLAMERGDKLGVLEERTERMHNQAQEFGSSAHQLMQKYKDKKWYQL